MKHRKILIYKTRTLTLSYHSHKRIHSTHLRLTQIHVIAEGLIIKIIMLLFYK